MRRARDQNIDVHLPRRRGQHFGIAEGHDLMTVDYSELQRTVLDRHRGWERGRLVPVAAHAPQVGRDRPQVVPRSTIRHVPRAQDL